MSLFLLNFWWIVLPDMEFILSVVLFQQFEYVISTAFWLPWFLMKIRCSYYGGSLIHDVSLLFGCFQDSLFVIFFQQFEYDVSWCGCLSFYPYLEFIELLGHVGYVFHQIWGVFGHYFFQIFVLPLSSSGTLLIVYFLCMGHIFLSLYMPYPFLLKTGYLEYYNVTTVEIRFSPLPRVC